MGKLMGFARMLECFNMSSWGCFCTNSIDEEEMEKLPLVGVDSNGGQKKRQKTFSDGIVHEKQTLAFQLKPKMVMLRVSMHCNGCARKVEKHISKMDGGSLYKVDLESKMVVVIGDVIPFEVLESVSKVKNAELWTFSKAEETC